MVANSFVDKVIDLKISEESGIAWRIYRHPGSVGPVRDLDELVGRSADLAIGCHADNPRAVYRQDMNEYVLRFGMG